MSDQTELHLDAEKGEPTETYELGYEPIRGYPELRWAGKRPFRATRYYPAQHRERFGLEVDGWRNKIYWGDSLQVMSHLLREHRSKIQLIYIDPPFDSKADYKKKIKLRGKTVYNDQNVFEEKQYSDIWTNDEYLQFMYERLILLSELVSQNGTIYVHCDSNKGHHIRSLMDEVLGPNYFRNEIIWFYENKLGTGGQTFDSSHDTLLVYTKSREWTHNDVMVPVKEVKKQPVTKKIDGKRVWLRDDKGNRLYEESKTERPIGDVWPLPIINPVASERLGYPTQKPESLLSYVIKASSNPGDIVLDCFMGSGTTQAVAMKLGRRFIGADINYGAIQTTKKRLVSVSREIVSGQSELNFGDGRPDHFYTGFDIYNVNQYDIFRNPIEAKDLLIEALEIQPLQQSTVYDGEKDGRMVKIMPVDRIATREDLNNLKTGFNYKQFDKRQRDNPNQPVERVTIVCMGHEPGLGAYLEEEVPYPLDVEVVDILRDENNLEFKRPSDARIGCEDGKLQVKAFYPMNLLQKLSLQKETVEDWRELVDSISIDFNYDGAVLNPSIVDVPDDGKLVKGVYEVPDDAGTIRVEIVDLLSETFAASVVSENAKAS